MGYGDLGVYGHPTIRTPNLDRMAAEGMKFTQFYAAAPLCTPSRAALLTGRLPIRSGMTSDVVGVLFPDSRDGLPPDEITIAEALKARGYATAAIGKWHLGHRPAYLPASQGFDSYFGIPYSNDMNRTADAAIAFAQPKIEYFDVPLMRDTEIVERPADQTTITRRYTEEALRFIHDRRDESFFLYLAYSLPHVPLFRSPAFEDVSARGLYGDVMEEIDWSVGQILQTLTDEGLAENTLVFFTSDNGPWLSYGEQGGSAGLLRGGKGMTWEGGMREPAIAWWPGTIAAGQVQTAVTSTLDLFPTAVAMAGAELPTDRIIDGRNLLPMLEGQSGPPADTPFFYYRGTRIYAVRKGAYKAHFATEWAYTADNQYTEHDPPLLYDLEHDPSEQFDIAAGYPEIVDDLVAEVARHRAGLVPHADQLAVRDPMYAD
jgi:arylsulfatase A